MVRMKQRWCIFINAHTTLCPKKVVQQTHVDNFVNS